MVKDQDTLSKQEFIDQQLDELTNFKDMVTDVEQEKNVPKKEHDKEKSDLKDKLSACKPRNIKHREETKQKIIDKQNI